MAKNRPEDNLISTINKSDNDLSLTGKPVLVQNNLGIFYGFLEKFDTRNQTALLSDAFKLSSERHITFTQYLDFVNGEIKDKVKVQHQSSEVDNILRNEIIIDQATLNEHARDISITDYASEGVYVLQFRTSTHENSRYIQNTVPMMSLSGVVATVLLNDYAVEYSASYLLPDSILGSITPEFTFVISSYLARLANSDYNPKDILYTELDKTAAYVLNESPTAGAYDGAIFDDLLDILPRLVVNTEQRIDLFKQEVDSYESSE